MGVEAFFEAIRKGEIDSVEQLLGTDPGLLQAIDSDGSSAVLLATYYGHSELLRRLLARHPELTIFEAAAAGVPERVREHLAQDPTGVRAYSPDGYTALGLASFFGHLEIVNHLLGRGAEVNAVSRNDMAVMPLHSAAAGRHAAIAAALIANGAEVNARSHGGWTPLHSAANHGQMEMVRLLLDHGARTDLRNDEGVAPAEMARAGGHIAVADLLSRRSG